MNSSGQDPLAGLVIGIIVLLICLYLITGKKLFGKMISDLANLVIGMATSLIKGIFQGIWGVIFKKKPESKENKNNTEQHFHFHFHGTPDPDDPGEDE
jgi:hypothetical protein